jgi:hypothetical protein
MRYKIIDFLSENGLEYKEKSRTIHTECPVCHSSDKFSILKENGSCICYRGSCSFGRQWFPSFVSLVSGITEKEARKMLYGKDERIKQVKSSDWQIKLELDDEEQHSEPSPLDGIPTVTYPEWFMLDIDSSESSDGLNYLLSRGITLEMAKKYDIKYSKFYRRVYLPIKMNGEVYGYQGRAIDKVAEKDRMRNNEGFRRDTFVMFADNLIGAEHVIISEGPFDAMKFEQVGGSVSTLGKVVTNKQLQIIKNYGIMKVYLALDEDAASEINELGNILRRDGLEVYRIEVPQSCIDRCEKLGKKADIGECTFEEAALAFKNAYKLDRMKLLLHLRG